MQFHHLNAWMKEGLVNSTRTHFLQCYYKQCILNHCYRITLFYKQYRIWHPVKDHHRLALLLWKQSCLLSELSSEFWFYTIPCISLSTSSQFVKKGQSGWWGPSPANSRLDAALSIFFCYPIGLSRKGVHFPLGHSSVFSESPSIFADGFWTTPLGTYTTFISFTTSSSFRIWLGLNSRYSLFSVWPQGSLT